MPHQFQIAIHHSPGKFTHALSEYFESKLFADVSICCPEPEFKYFDAHRLVLSISSQYFKNILEEVETIDTIIYVREVPPEMMEFALKFCYFEEILVPAEKIDGFLTACKFLKINDVLMKDAIVTNFCEEPVTRNANMAISEKNRFPSNSSSVIIEDDSDSDDDNVIFVPQPAFFVISSDEDSDDVANAKRFGNEIESTFTKKRRTDGADRDEKLEIYGVDFDRDEISDRYEKLDSNEADKDRDEVDRYENLVLDEADADRDERIERNGADRNRDEKLDSNEAEGDRDRDEKLETDEADRVRDEGDRNKNGSVTTEQGSDGSDEENPSSSKKKRFDRYVRSRFN